MLDNHYTHRKKMAARDDQTDAKPPAPTSSCSTTRTFYNISFEALDERGPFKRAEFRSGHPDRATLRAQKSAALLK